MSIKLVDSYKDTDSPGFLVKVPRRRLLPKREYEINFFPLPKNRTLADTQEVLKQAQAWQSETKSSFQKARGRRDTILQGRKRQSSFFDVPYITIGCPFSIGTPNKNPVWSRNTFGVLEFKTYAPVIVLSIPKHLAKKEIKGSVWRLTFRVDSEALYRKRFTQAVSQLIKTLPELAEQENEYLENMPSWMNFLEYVSGKYEKAFGKKYWE